MSGKIPLTLDEEFRFYTATLMNNWSALKLLISHSEDCVPIRNSKVEGLLELLINSIQGIMHSKVELFNCVDNLEDYIDLKFDTYIEDNSCEEVLNELLTYYNLLSCNNREELSRAIPHLKEKRSIFNNEEYNPDLIVRVTTPHQSSHQPIDRENNVSVKNTSGTIGSTMTNRENNVSVENTSETIGSTITNEHDDGWQTVSHRKNKYK